MESTREILRPSQNRGASHDYSPQQRAIPPTAPRDARAAFAARNVVLYNRLKHDKTQKCKNVATLMPSKIDAPTVSGDKIPKFKVGSFLQWSKWLCVLFLRAILR